MEKQLVLGATVKCSDGTTGKLERIVTDPEKKRPAYIVVKYGRPRLREAVVPVSLVAEVTTEAVLVDLDRETLGTFPTYEVRVEKGTHSRPQPGRAPHTWASRVTPADSGYVVLRQRPVPDRTIGVRKGFAVRDASGREIGKVDGMRVDSEEQRVRYLIVRPAPLHLRPRLVSVELVEGAESDHIRLRIDRDHVEGLPIYEGEA